MYMLEERILFDGAAAADVTEAEAQTEQQAEAQPEAQQDDQTTEQDSSEQQDSSADEASGDLTSDTTDSEGSTTYSELDAVLNEFLTQSGTETENNPGVLIISSLIDDADTLAAAAKDNVIVVRYDAETTTLDQLLEQVRDALDGREASSIGIAAHDYGDAKFYLTGTETISLGSTLASESQREFWTDMGSMLAENGRIDLFACGLASSDTGLMLVSSLENISGINFAASTDSTGNLAAGGDWMLETDNVDLTDTYFDKDRLDDFSGLLASEVKKLEESSETGFGESVSIDGDYAVVGGSLTGISKAYLFYKDQGGYNNWGLVKQLATYETTSVCISGDYIITGNSLIYDNVAAKGTAYIFYKDQGGTNNWGLVKTLSASDGFAGDKFGSSVSIAGEYAIVGACELNARDYDMEAAYIFYKDQGGTNNWGEVTKLVSSDFAANDMFGCSVSISGDYAIVGALGDDDAGSASGSAYIFYKNQGGSNNWGELKKLTASDSASGDAFGCSVDIDNTNIVIGARGVSDYFGGGGVYWGAAYIFSKDQGGADNWGGVTKLLPSNPNNYHYLGYSVSIDGDYALVGMRSDPHLGSAYIFYKDQGGSDNWGQLVELTASDEAINDFFGYTVSISGKTLIIGTEYSGDSAYVFSLDDTPVQANIEAGALSYTENNISAITSTLTLTDSDDTNLESATIQITGNYQNGEDVLSFVNTANITGTWNAATGMLTLTGSDTVANYQAALRAVKYENTCDDPNTAQRTVSFIVNDGDLNSNTVTRNIDITPVNDAPSLNVENTALEYTFGSGESKVISDSLTVSDPDDTNIESATVQITGNYQSGEDLLEFTDTGSITGTWDAATGTLTLTGTDTVANYQAALRTVTYKDTSTDTNTEQRTITFSVNDGDTSSSLATRTVGTITSDENEGGDEGSEDEVPPTGIDDGTSNNGLPDNDDENNGNGNGNDNQGNNGNHNNNWGYYNHLFDIMQNFRGHDIFSVVNELAHNGHFQVSDDWLYQGQLDLSNIFNNPNTNIQNAWQYFLSNGMPDGENGSGNGNMFFNLGDGEDFSGYQFQPSGDGDEFALLEASTCSRFANTDIFEKHPLFKTDYEKALDELIAV